MTEFKTKSGRTIEFFGQEGQFELKPLKENASIRTLEDLFAILLECWCKETAYPGSQADYDFENDPSYGQCAITAILVSDWFGGTIHKIRVDGGGTHYFNKIDGEYFDLTSDQFALYDIPVSYEPNEEVSREYCGKNQNTAMRYELLKERVAGLIGGGTV